MGKTCASLFVDLFPYSYEADVVQNFVKFGEQIVAKSFNSINR